MLFNSVVFSVFLPIVFSLYWITKNNLKRQNLFLLIASYVFYSWWDWRFLFLLISLSVFNFFIGKGIDNSDNQNRRKIWLISGLIINLGILGLFKYFNFFIDSFIDLVSLIGYKLPRSSVRIILPLGISFYIFLSLSYLLDIYKKTISAGRNIIEVLLCLGFFPIILAGPIQRPSTLLPQIVKKREYSHDQIVDGLRQILWGLFTKVVIADNLSFYADDIFLNYSGYHGSVLLIGIIFYSIQIYADFSGYSDMAIGTAKLFGFSLMRNFAYPYFSRDIVEFWKRWHISLTTWFRDYVFLPISFFVSWRIKGAKILLIKTDLFIYIVASLITWFLTGLWHGANYTFLVWGMIHGLVLILYRVQKDPRKKLLMKAGISSGNKVIVFIETIITLSVVLVSWIFFRADSVEHGLKYLSGLFSGSLFSLPQFSYSRRDLLVITFLVISFLTVEWKGRNEPYGISWVRLKHSIIGRWAVYYTLIVIIFFFAGSGQKFIYFQF